MIKAIIFDKGGVVINKAGSSFYQDIVKLAGIKRKKDVLFLKELIKELQKGFLSEKEFCKIMHKKYGVEPSRIYKTIEERYEKKVRKNKGVEKIIKRLIKLKYKVALLSNTIPLHQRISKKFFDDKLFSQKILSYQVGMRKPEIEIYKLALKNLGLRPSECVYIDDTKDLLKPAKKLGMKTIHFKSAKQLEQELIKYKVL